MKISADKEMNLFIDINSKQVKVSRGLLVELYSDLHWCSSDAEEAFQALLSRISSRLSTEKTSPLNAGRQADLVTHERIIVFRSGGNSISRTAKLTGCSQAQVKRVWARHQKESGKPEMVSQKLSSATVQKSGAKPSL